MADNLFCRLCGKNLWHGDCCEECAALPLRERIAMAIHASVTDCPDLWKEACVDDPGWHNAADAVLREIGPTRAPTAMTERVEKLSAQVEALHNDLHGIDERLGWLEDQSPNPPPSQASEEFPRQGAGR